MKRLILIIMGVLLCTHLYADMNTYIAGSSGVEAGGDYTDILFWWRGEGETLTADDYSSDMSATNSSTEEISISSTAAQVGTNSVDVHGNYAVYSFDAASNINGSEGIVGFWLYIDTLTTNQYFFHAVDGTDNTDYFYLKLDGDEIKAAWSIDGSATMIGGTTYSMTANMAISTWYYVTFSWNNATPSRVISVYNSSGVLLDDYENTSAFTGIAFESGDIFWGAHSATTGDCHIDNMVISNDDSRDLVTLRNETSSPR